MQNTMNYLYHLASQAKNMHWNITGASFYGLHVIGDEIDGQARENGDRVAERMRFHRQNPVIRNDTSLGAVSVTATPRVMIDQLKSLLEDGIAIVERDRRNADSPDNNILDEVEEFLGKYIFFLTSFDL